MQVILKKKLSYRILLKEELFVLTLVCLLLICPEWIKADNRGVQIATVQDGFVCPGSLSPQKKAVSPDSLVTVQEEYFRKELLERLPAKEKDAVRRLLSGNPHYAERLFLMMNVNGQIAFVPHVVQFDEVPGLLQEWQDRNTVDKPVYLLLKRHISTPVQEWSDLLTVVKRFQEKAGHKYAGRILVVPPVKAVGCIVTYKNGVRNGVVYAKSLADLEQRLKESVKGKWDKLEVNILEENKDRVNDKASVEKMVKEKGWKKVSVSILTPTFIP